VPVTAPGSTPEHVGARPAAPADDGPDERGAAPRGTGAASGTSLRDSDPSGPARDGDATDRTIAEADEVLAVEAAESGDGQDHDGHDTAGDAGAPDSGDPGPAGAVGAPTGPAPGTTAAVTARPAPGPAGGRLARARDSFRQLTARLAPPPAPATTPWGTPVGNAVSVTAPRPVAVKSEPIQVRPIASRTIARGALVAALMVLFVYAAATLVWNVRSVLLTVFIGLFLAIGFDPVIIALQRVVKKRGAAVALFFLLLLAFLATFSYLALRPAVTQLTELAGQIPGWVKDAQDTNTTIGRFLSRPEVASRVQSFTSNIGATAVGSVGTVFSVIGTILGGTVTALAVVALMIYFMLSMPRMLLFTAAAVGGGEKAGVMREALSKVGGYVIGQLTICACAGIASGIFFVIVGMPYAAVVAIAVAILDAIPQVGATLGAVLSTLVALTQSIPLAIGTLAFFLVYQQLENYLIAPRMFARSVNLSAVAVLIAVLVGGSVAGVVGALFALPVTAALKTVLAYAFRDRLTAIEVVEHREADQPTA